ncbi:hypothetical protein [Desulfomonile tiedjei]|uniref:Uncharacterized protein n=1 Tax=Desulfomonile tiedjei (strain ATCC 49306 / DSM 6799 / DCB-1) TaxID=706587 RepID=I4C6K0_DESTA|nr:hypothetical protein [Desulfomonile tiedjei]AFM25191.1 hypothetical protein Desti_2511 [Desulfomonile tiedjei DSM 6799]
MEIVKIYDPVILAGGYTSLYVIPIEFSRSLDPIWVEKLKEKYDELSLGSSESIVFEPVEDSPLLDWSAGRVDSDRLLFVVLNQQILADGIHVKPDPERAREWIIDAVDFANQSSRDVATETKVQEIQQHAE